ncbi:MAG: hypothetical protein J5706_00275 [Elusimicrobiales bacterium]|nr:hypothetical protein [Elusimicrobiales bacterium]
MAKIIRFIIGLAWFITTGFTLFLIFNVIQTEPNQQIVWSWIVVCSLIFLSISFLAYVAIFQKPHVNIREIGKD